MVSKGFKAMIAEANAAVPRISVDDAKQRLDAGDAVFVDVRESREVTSGAIPGSVHAPRGFLEFLADPEGPMHKPELASGKTLIVYCASGGRSALAGKTLLEMGLDNVINLAGGMAAWQQAEGPIEKA
jgi:rhodanese-related sulfurtransferase